MRAQYARRRQRLGRVYDEPIPDSHTGHPLFGAAARLLARLGIHRDSYLNTIHDPLWEDAASEVVLAILEGRSPTTAARRWIADERQYQRTHLRLFDES